MSWTLLIGLVVVLGVALFLTLVRRVELRALRENLEARRLAVRTGAARPQLMHPVIDHSRCMGCGSCVEACPEDDVLALVHGQAVVVHGARCEGISACERECPVGAITVTLADADTRRDVPALDEKGEAVGAPGIFLAGEVTARALVRVAVEQGTAAAAAAARRADETPGLLDLVIVGAGPAGLSCALEAQRLGLRFIVLESEDRIGGTVARYPRNKLILTRPLELPLYGRITREELPKEELMAIWEEIAARYDLPLHLGEPLESIERTSGGDLIVWSPAGSYQTRSVCLAVGRRGTPRRLGVPGEELPKVTYGLQDAREVQGRSVLIVGGGDSAVEAALALAPHNRVTLSYRREAFFRLRGRNQERIDRALAQGALTFLAESVVRAIHPERVELAVAGRGEVSLPNDLVLVLIGGTPPTDLLQAAGVSCDPALRPALRPTEEQGNGLVRALAAALALSLLALGWVLAHYDYYSLPLARRPAHPLHDSLRPGQGFGLAMGISACVLIAINLLYLARRSPRSRLRLGSLRAWMSSHVTTGILAVLCALLHASMAPRDTLGGHAFWALAALLFTGAVGRYFYAWVPRAANGRELELEEVRARLGELTHEGGDGFGERVQEEVEALVARRRWQGSFLGRVRALLAGERDLWRTLARLRAEGGEDAARVQTATRLARQAYRAATQAGHAEELRAVLASWRWLHRWVAVLMVVLLTLHVIYALAYGAPEALL